MLFDDLGVHRNIRSNRLETLSFTPLFRRLELDFSNKRVVGSKPIWVRRSLNCFPALQQCLSILVDMRALTYLLLDQNCDRQVRDDCVPSHAENRRRPRTSSLFGAASIRIDCLSVDIDSTTLNRRELP